MADVGWATKDILSRISVDKTFILSRDKIDIDALLKSFDGIQDFDGYFNQVMNLNFECLSDVNWVRVRDRLENLLGEEPGFLKEVWGLGLFLSLLFLIMLLSTPFWGLGLGVLGISLGAFIKKLVGVKRAREKYENRREKLNIFKKEMSLNIGVSQRLDRESKRVEKRIIGVHSDLISIDNDLLTTKDLISLVSAIEIDITFLPKEMRNNLSVELYDILDDFRENRNIALACIRLEELNRKVTLHVMRECDELFDIEFDNFLDKYYHRKSGNKKESLIRLGADLGSLINKKNKKRNNMLGIRFAEIFYDTMSTCSLSEIEDLSSVVCDEFVPIVIKYFELMFGLEETNSFSRIYLDNLIKAIYNRKGNRIISSQRIRQFQV